MRDEYTYKHHYDALSKKMCDKHNDYAYICDNTDKNKYSKKVNSSYDNVNESQGLFHTEESSNNSNLKFNTRIYNSPKASRGNKDVSFLNFHPLANDDFCFENLERSAPYCKEPTPSNYGTTRLFNGFPGIDTRNHARDLFKQQGCNNKCLYHTLFEGDSSSNCAPKYTNIPTNRPKYGKHNPYE